MPYIKNCRGHSNIKEIGKIFMINTDDDVDDDDDDDDNDDEGIDWTKSRKVERLKKNKSKG